MFIDYYIILDIDENASLDEIKSAFKRQALKWHPDRNIGLDTTKRMQEINEAYLILKDNEARKRYNLEYQKFKNYIIREQSEHNKNKRGYAKEETYEYSGYNFDDDTLNKWMTNARKQAVDLAKQTIEDFKGMASIGAKEAVKGAGTQFIYQIIAGIILVLIFALTKNCGK